VVLREVAQSLGGCTARVYVIPLGFRQGGNNGIPDLVIFDCDSVLVDSKPVINLGTKAWEPFSLNKVRRASRRAAFRARLSAKLNRARLLYALCIGLIVGIGMAVFAPCLHQSRLFLGFGSGIAAFLMMLFLD
jgi:hypothetical protein